MLHHLGHAPNILPDDWENFRSPICLCVGDQDSTAGIESTVQIYKKLKDGRLCVLPETPHPFNKVNVDRLSLLISDFLIGQ